jgi:hypothetical protein
MKTLIRTKDIARVRLSEKHATDYLRVTYTDGTYSEWVADHYEESMSQREKCKQLKLAYKEITEACKTNKEFVEFEID